MTARDVRDHLGCETLVEANRSAHNWSRREKFGRVLWAVVRPVFRLSPRPFWGFRRALLRVFGARVGAAVHVWPTVRITIPWNLTLGDECAVGDGAILYALGPIGVGKRATISQGAHLCAGTHDWRDPTMPLLKPPINIGSDTWICAEAFIGPNVCIGSGAIVAARSVVIKDVGDAVMVGGNPALFIKNIERRMCV